MHLHNIFTNSQAQTMSHWFFACLMAHLVELVKNAFQVVFIYAITIIAHIHSYSIILAVGGYPNKAILLITVFYRIRK